MKVPKIIGLFICSAILFLGCAPKTDQHFLDNVKIGMSMNDFDKKFYYMKKCGVGETSFSNEFRLYTLPSGKDLVVDFQKPRNSHDFFLVSYNIKDKL